jgi:hypothetical protein
MSDAHKAALAKGREEGRTVRLYLEGLEACAPKRGRKRTPDSIKRRLTNIDRELVVAEPLTRLHLLQEQTNLENELERGQEKIDLVDLEKGFVKCARHYAQRKGITYATWRQAGVSPDVLKRAGIARTRG